MAIHPISSDDIIVLPCGFWCYRSELSDLSENTHKSNGYEVLFVDTPAYTQFLEAQEFGIEQPEA